MARRPPLVPLERDAAAAIELNALTLEQQSLRERRRSIGADADHAACVDDAVPWHGRAARQRMQRISHEPRLPWHFCECRDLAICGHAPPWDAPYHGKNGLMCRCHTGTCPVAHRTVEV